MIAVILDILCPLTNQNWRFSFESISKLSYVISSDFFHQQTDTSIQNDSPTDIVQVSTCASRFSRGAFHSWNSKIQMSLCLPTFRSKYTIVYAFLYKYTPHVWSNPQTTALHVSVTCQPYIGITQSPQVRSHYIVRTGHIRTKLNICQYFTTPFYGQNRQFLTHQYFCVHRMLLTLLTQTTSFTV